MATRAHLREQITSDKIGALTPVAFATVAVYQTGTTTPVTGTLYSTATGVGTLTNPLTADANGVVEFWMTSAQVVDLAITAAGYNTATVTAQVVGGSTATGIVSLNTTQALANAGDVLITGEDFTYEGTASAHTVGTLDRAQTYTGLKTFSAGVSADGTHTVTLPSATDTLVGKATTDTLTNKTLTSPNITTPVLTGSGGTLTLPAGPDALVGRATTDTLANKTLTAPKLDVIKDTSGNTVETITAGGGVQFGSPTGGDKGAGTINTQAGHYAGGNLAISATGVPQVPATGAYTPTMTPASGSFTAASATGRFVQVGHLVYVAIVATITTVGTASGGFTLTLPVAATQITVLLGREDATTGRVAQCKVLVGSTTSTVLDYSNTPIMTSASVFYLSGWYEA